MVQAKRNTFLIPPPASQAKDATQLVHSSARLPQAPASMRVSFVDLENARMVSMHLGDVVLSLTFHNEQLNTGYSFF